MWSAVLVIAGVMLAMRRRMRDEGASALQLFTEDFLPLILLFAVSISGLMLTVSYTWLKGYGYDFLTLLHAMTVIFTLSMAALRQVLPHLPTAGPAWRRVLQRRGRAGGSGALRALRTSLRLGMHVSDLIQVERELGYRYEIDQPGLEHYQWICPPCRRAMFALAQGSADGAAGAGR